MREWNFMFFSAFAAIQPICTSSQIFIVFDDCDPIVVFGDSFSSLVFFHIYAEGVFYQVLTD